MADTKISALTSATIPLAGTEVLPVVQSGVTKQVSVADLTAGRAVSASSLTLTGSPLATGSGGTGLTSFTSNGIVYASSTSALTTGSGFAYNGTTRVLLLSNSSATLAHYSVGRTAAETRMGVVAATNDFLTGTVAGDGVLYALSGNAWYGTATNYSCIFTTNNTERAKIDTSGNYVPKAANTGINFTANTAASGMTSQLLNWYEEITAASTACTGAITTAAVWKLTRVGNLITLTLPPITGAATSSAYFEFGVLVPSGYRPSSSLMVPCGVRDNDANQNTAGMCIITSSGNIRVYPSISASANFTANASSTAAGFAQGCGFTCSWRL